MMLWLVKVGKLDASIRPFSQIQSQIMPKNKNCALSIITTSIQISLNKSLLIADNVESLF